MLAIQPRWRAVAAGVGLLIGLGVVIQPVSADTGSLWWEKMSAKHFAIFQHYARRMMTADADHQSLGLTLWSVRRLQVNEYLVKMGSDGRDPSRAGAGLGWLQGQLAAGSGGQLDGESAIDLDVAIKAIPELPSLDVWVPSIDIYVNDQPLPDIGRLSAQHDAGLQRQVAHRGYGCQMARWLRGAEIVKAVGFLQVGADDVPPNSRLTPFAMNALCANRIALYGLGLDFLPSGVGQDVGQSIMAPYQPWDSVMADYDTDQPLLELLYRSGLKPGTPKADVVKLIDGLKLP